jgi:hypothetical protein
MLATVERVGVPSERPRAAGRARFWALAALRVTRRPLLWPTALVQAARFVPARWWRRAPFLPVPDRAYLRFRLRAQYGTGGEPEPGDLVTYLEWCRQMARNQHRRRDGRR